MDQISEDLRWVGKAIPKELRRRLMTKVNPMAAQKEKLENLVKHGYAPRLGRKTILKQRVKPEVERAIRSVLEHGSMNKYKEVVNKDIERRMEKIVDEQVKRVIEKHGGLEKVRRQVAQDPFVLRRLGLK